MIDLLTNKSDLKSHELNQQTGKRSQATAIRHLEACALKYDSISAPESQEGHSSQSSDDGHHQEVTSDENSSNIHQDPVIVDPIPMNAPPVMHDHCCNHLLRLVNYCSEFFIKLLIFTFMFRE